MEINIELKFTMHNGSWPPKFPLCNVNPALFFFWGGGTGSFSSCDKMTKNRQIKVGLIQKLWLLSPNLS